jgi:hypothetical protein
MNGRKEWPLITVLLVIIGIVWFLHKTKGNSSYASHVYPYVGLITTTKIFDAVVLSNSLLLTPRKILLLGNLILT